MTLDEFYAHPDAEDHIAAWQNEREMCKFHGGPMSECPDDEKDWFPQRHVCYVAMQLEAAKRLYELQHEDAPYHNGSFLRWAKKPSRDFPFHYLDGVTIWMSEVELSPDDDFLSQGPSASADESDAEA